MSSNKKQIVIDQGLFTVPANSGSRPNLIGSKCESCGITMFPPQNICINCCKDDTRSIELSSSGKVWASTVTRKRQPLYEGPVPFSNGLVELEEGVLIPALFTGFGTEYPVPIGTEVEIEIIDFGEDSEGNSLITYAFRAKQN